MSSRAVQLVIDARPRGPRGLMAAEVVLGRSMLGHLLDLAQELAPPCEPVVVHARDEERGQLRTLAGALDSSGVVFACGAPGAEATVLRTDCFYDAGRLRRSLRHGRSPESAVLWRLDRPESLSTANEELTRRLTYQPLGKYWAFPVAQRLAQRLCPTAIRPNALTLATAALMIGAAGSVATGSSGWIDRFTVALALSVALVLDTADGRLARLQGTSSALGRWLDQVLDELADLALHAAIAWGAFCRDGQPIWLVLGMLYASGKYLFLVQSLLGNELEGGRNETATRPGLPVGGGAPGRSSGALDRLAGIMRMIGHADLRWHLWIVLAVLGRLELALVFYAGYFVARALAAGVRKGVRYA
jgi:phosphatidylglycerophosphate synthase